MKDFFGLYNIRSRLSVSIYVLAPALILIFMTVPEARALSSTIVFGLVLIPISNLIIISSRRLGVQAMRRSFDDLLPAQRFLLPSDETLNTQTKSRYYTFFKQNIPQFTESSQDSEMRPYVEDAVTWLIAKTRDVSKYPLIHEENMNFGFAYNLLGLKRIGIFLNVVSIAINILLVYFATIGQIPQNITTIYICLLINFGILLTWIFVITKSLVISCGNKYARALLSACDNLEIKLEAGGE